MNPEIIKLENDIKVFFITATSFPEGILEAHQKLHAMVPYSINRKYLGISRPENGKIVYKAAVEEGQRGEAERYKCDTLILKKGNYISLIINDYKKDLQRIEQAFLQLLSYPDLDPEGYCVEWYMSDEKTVTCMIRLR
jgi:hypothetical protein